MLGDDSLIGGRGHDLLDGGEDPDREDRDVCDVSHGDDTTEGCEILAEKQP